MMSTEKRIHPLFVSPAERTKLQLEAANRTKQDVVVNTAPPTGHTESDNGEKKPKSRRKTQKAGEDATGSASEAKDKPKRKKKVDKEDEGFRSSGRTKEPENGVRKSNRKSLANSSAAITALFAAAPPLETETDAHDLHEARRKRRKRSNSPASGDQSGSEDVVMEDVAPATENAVQAAAPAVTEAPQGTEPEKEKEAAETPRASLVSAEIPAPAPVPEILPTTTSAAIPPTQEATSAPNPVPAADPPKPAPAPAPKKPTHWFFSARKPAPKPTSSEPDTKSVPEKTIDLTEPSAAEQRRRNELKSSASRGFSGFQITHTEKPKFPGVPEAPWPTREQRHVRGFEGRNKGQEAVIPRIDRGKRKDRLIEVPKSEDVLAVLANRLCISECEKQVSRPDYVHEKFFTVSHGIRAPERLLLTGKEMQQEVKRRLSCQVPAPGHNRNKVLVQRRSSLSSNNSTDSLVVVIPHSHNADDNSQIAHPAIKRLYTRLLDVNTPYDEGRCTSASWLQKYAPQTTADVLQSKTNMNILRTWLGKLRVDNVETAESSLAKAEKRKKEKLENKQKVKKRKIKRNSDLDDFLVDSDDANTLDEITDPDETGSNCSYSFMGGHKEKSKITKFSPTSNVIVIHGPQGCGKTAAVHAVAKELGYSVFELNAGNRRSGKDILDQVGQMSKNHLVHQAKETSNPFSFAKKEAKSEKDSKPTQQQQQSLILFEEVDLLFEEDKQFWPTVVSLASQSKRPIVLTCNDEKLVPISSLPVYGTLSFTEPEENAAVDYLLVMAALEGHIIEREAIHALYKSIGLDLRGTITQLQLWCQMGVGDRHSGISWLNIERLSTSKSTDKRVVSKGTYRRGLGLFPTVDSEDELPEEDVWKFAWDEYELDLGGEDLGMDRKMDSWAQNFKSTKENQFSGLQAFELYTEALSAVDVYSLDGMRGLDDPVLDALAPPVTEKSLAEDIVGYEYLRPLRKASPSSTENTLLAVTARSLAREALRADTLHDMEDTTEQLPKVSSGVMVDCLGHLDFNRWPMTLLDPNMIRKSLRPILNSLSDTVTVPVLAEELAPIIRGVVRHDESLIREQEELRRKGKRTTRRSIGVVSERKNRGSRWWAGVGDVWDGILDTGGPDWDLLAPVMVGQDVEVPVEAAKQRGVVDADDMDEKED